MRSLITYRCVGYFLFVSADSLYRDVANFVDARFAHTAILILFRFIISRIGFDSISVIYFAGNYRQN